MVLFLTRDLMFSSRVLGAAQALGVPLKVVGSAAELSEKLSPECRLVFIDLALDGLDLPDAVKAVRESPGATAQVVAFGAHVNEQALSSAAAAGCDQVLTRGQFHKVYTELLRAAV